MSVPEAAAAATRADVSRSTPEPERPIPALTRARIALVRAFLVGWIRCFSLSGLYSLGRFFGTCEYLCDYKRRKRVHVKLQTFFKDKATTAWRRRITRRYFMRVRCDKMFYTIMDRIPRDKLLNRIKFQDRDKVDAILARGNGLYVALCHYGSHHVAGLMLALLGYKLVGVRDPRESPVRRYIQQKYRETFPEVADMKLFFSDSFPRELFRCFKEQYIVASLLDVDRQRGENLRTCPVQIFGETREFLTGPLKIALRCRAPVIQGFVVSRPNFYYKLVVGKHLVDPDAVGDEDETIAKVMQAYADGVERHAREYPDHLMKI